MEDQNPEFVMRHRINGRIFGCSPHLENEAELEKIPFEVAYPEKCMPEHVIKKVAAKKAATAKKANTKKKAATKAPTKKAPTKKPDLDLSTENIPDDPEEILGEDSLSSEIDLALSEDASKGL
jgi:hypothetical protein